jgi:DNA-binding NtrC family response regulator
VDVRVIAATNRDLEAMIARGQFRTDLYYRLKGVVLELPPLRERGDDLSQLASHFLAKVARERGEEPRVLSPEALELLKRHPFPGNIRELENVVASASLFAQGRVITLESFEHLPELRGLAPHGGASQQVEPRPATLGVAAPLAPPPAAPSAAAPPPEQPAANGALDYFGLVRQRGLSLKDLRQEIELQCITRALQEARGNISEAARLLKMKRSRLSQIVNSEPSIRGLAGGEAPGDSADDEEGD